MKRRHEELKLREEGQIEGKARKIKTASFPDMIQNISTYSIAPYSLPSLLLIRGSNHLYLLINLFLVPKNDEFRPCEDKEKNLNKERSRNRSAMWSFMI